MCLLGGWADSANTCTHTAGDHLGNVFCGCSAHTNVLGHTRSSKSRSSATAVAIEQDDPRAVSKLQLDSTPSISACLGVDGTANSRGLRHPRLVRNPAVAVRAFARNGVVSADRGGLPQTAWVCGTELYFQTRGDRRAWWFLYLCYNLHTCKNTHNQEANPN